MKENSIKFTIYLVVFIISFDLAIGWIFDQLYFSDKSRRNDRLVYSVMNTNEEILIFGSSRALHHYNPIILQDSLGMTCFNVGSGGQNIYFHLALLKATLERYTPKIVILELVTIDIEKTPPQWDTEKLAALWPFAKHTEAAKEAVFRRGIFEKIKSLSRIYRFNSLFYNILKNNLIEFSNHQNGYIPIKRVWNKELEYNKLVIKDEDNDKILALKSFIEICESNKISLHIFISPHYALKESNSMYNNIINDLREDYNIQVHNFESDSLFMLHSNYFADPLHLNSAGADLFTEKVLRVLSNELSQLN